MPEQLLSVRKTQDRIVSLLADKTRPHKQAMMLELLTGRTRLL